MSVTNDSAVIVRKDSSKVSMRVACTPAAARSSSFCSLLTSGSGHASGRTMLKGLRSKVTTAAARCCSRARSSSREITARCPTCTPSNLPIVTALGPGVAHLEVGRRVMAGNWPSAVIQGRVAARNMAGASEEFRNVSSYATNLAGLDIIAVGDTDRAAADSTVVVGSAVAGGVTQLFVRAGKVVGATLVGRNADRKTVTDGIKAGLLVENVKLQ